MPCEATRRGREGFSGESMKERRGMVVVVLELGYCSRNLTFTRGVIGSLISILTVCGR